MVEPDGGSFPSRLTTRNRNIFELGMLDFNFRFAFHHLHQCVEWGRVFAQSLSFVEGENRHDAGRLLDDLAAHNGTVLVVDEIRNRR
jgi:hypothetical protein